MLRFFENKEAQKSATLSKSWQKTGQSIQRSNTGKYKKNLQPREIELVEAVCFDSMQQYGYQPEHTAIPKLPTSREHLLIQFTERIMRLKVETDSMRKDKNHWIRWKRDLTASYFALRNRGNSAH